jgi:3-oxoacyl-[acyl-carrier-protein] synthase II
MNRVVVTGIGVVTSHGIGKKELFTQLIRGKRAEEPIPAEFEKAYTFSSRFYVPFPEFDLKAHGISSPFIRIMQEEDRCAVLCAKLALDDAGFTLERRKNLYSVKNLDNAGILLGTGFSGLKTAFHSHCAHLCGDKSGHHYSRIVIPQVMPNSVAAWVSIFFGIKGASSTLNASCASGTVAIGRAFRLIRDGHQTCMLSGGVECLKESTGALMRGFDMLGALTKSGDGNPRPFSKQRSGFLFSEGGGCIVVIEELEHALARGAGVYAEIVDYRENSDAYGIVQIDPDATQIISLLSALKAERNIDYINTHGTGTLANDETEARAIRKVFGNRGRPVASATKAILGHTIGASGAIEAAVTALSIKEKRIHGSGTVDDPLDISLAQESADIDITYAISTSYGFGGHNTGLLFKGYENNG